MPTYYDVLRVAPTASVAEIEAALDAQYHQCRRLVTHHKPEVANKATLALRKIEQMRAVLTDPAKRAEYDAQLGSSYPSNISAQLPISDDGKTSGVVCPRCHTENPENVRFCKSCGQTLIGECPRCNTPVMFYEKFCPKCGGNIEELKYQKELEAAEYRRRAQEEARRQEEEWARREIQRKRLEALENGLSIMGGILGAIAAPLFWAATWPDVMGTPVGIIAQIIMGAFAGVRSNRRLVEKAEKWHPIIAYGIGVFAGIVAGVGSFPFIVVTILHFFITAK